MVTSLAGGRSHPAPRRASSFMRRPGARLLLRGLSPLASVLLVTAESAATDRIDTSGYHLFNPVPEDQLREMSTDRPDKTESPHTVDAGHVQVESDLVSYTRDDDESGGGDTRVESWAAAHINFKIGLLNNVDIQTIIESYNHITTEDRVADTETTQSGFGDLTSRVKINLWGNDGGAIAVALMPFVKFPTSQDDIGNDSVEGGLILPIGGALPAGFDVGGMTEVDFNRDERGDGHHTEFVNTIEVGHDLVGALGGYVEFFSAVSTESDAEWIGTVDVGFTYGFTENVQLDAGVNIGVTDAADDYNPFLGLSIRR
jgi:hypothetical protein